MADVLMTLLDSPPLVLLAAPEVVPFTISGAGATSSYFMRALADPGPGFIYWVSSIQDYLGVDAGAAIQAGTAVILDVRES